MFQPVLLLAAVAVGTVPAAAALASARWPYRSPAAAILLWQALGLSWGLPEQDRCRRRPVGPAGRRQRGGGGNGADGNSGEKQDRLKHRRSVPGGFPK